MKAVQLLLVLAASLCAQDSRVAEETALATRARQIHANALVLDAHIDTPYRLTREPADISQRLANGHFDFVRAREGGLDASVFAIYVASRFDYSGNAKAGAFAEARRILRLIDNILAQNASTAAQASTPREVQRLAQSGKHAIILSLENGSAIENDLANLRPLAQRGLCYVTLTHSKDNQISDSSYDRRRTHRGLSAFGKEVVRELNRLGVMIDVAHVSDEAFWQVLALTQAPVIASHSSVRKLRRVQRNLSDSMLVALKQNRGVVCINFGSFFLSEAFQASVVKRDRQLEAARKTLKSDPAQLQKELDRIRAASPIINATLADLIEHIDYAVKLIGVEHVGLGSDFDGVDVAPLGLEDTRCYPKITAELLKRGYAEGEVRKILGENFLRVWQENLDRRF
jgi:membrane dipeptidase